MIPSNLGKSSHFLGFQEYSCPEHVFSAVDFAAKGAQASQHPAIWAMSRTGPQ